MLFDRLKIGIKYLWSGIFVQPYRNLSIAWTSRRPYGTNVFSLNWDVLLVLDTCRVDAMTAVADEYRFIETVDSLRSVGGDSTEWLAKTFTEEWKDILAETAYITANPWAQTVLGRLDETNGTLRRLQRYGRVTTISDQSLGKVEYLSPDAAGATDMVKTPPRWITDRIIETVRNGRYKRVIGHYMQPHIPYVEQAQRDDRVPESYEKAPINYLRRTGDTDRVFEAYLNNLRLALDEIEVVLESIDANTIAITADHGDAFGEFGIDHHHAGSLHPKIRRVPWVVTSANDNGEYIPSFDPESMGSRSRKEMLRALGYLN